MVRLKEKRVSSENPKGRLSKNWSEKELSVFGCSILDLYYYWRWRHNCWSIGVSRVGFHMEE